MSNQPTYSSVLDSFPSPPSEVILNSRLSHQLNYGKTSPPNEVILNSHHQSHQLNYVNKEAVVELLNKVIHMSTLITTVGRNTREKIHNGIDPNITMHQMEKILSNSISTFKMLRDCTPERKEKKAEAVYKLVTTDLLKRKREEGEYEGEYQESHQYTPFNMSARDRGRGSLRNFKG